MDSNLINDLLAAVKANKKYNAISDEIVLNEINNYISKNKLKIISKQDVKNIRNSLHKSYASFQTKHKNKTSNYLDELEDKIKKNKNITDVTDKLLSISISTKERISNYRHIYNEIFKITSIPKSIIDLGSGFNPFSYPLMNLKELNYYAYDINNEDINFLNKYLKIMKQRGLNGRAQILNIRDLEKISKLPSSDVIFMFKLIDIIDTQNHKPSEHLIKFLFDSNKTKFIVASFATKTLTRKPMNFPGRKWFEIMLKRIGLKFQAIKTDNEIFYVIYN